MCRRSTRKCDRRNTDDDRSPQHQHQHPAPALSNQHPAEQPATSSSNQLPATSPSFPHQPPPIHHQIMPRDKGRTIRTQIDHGVRDFVRPRQPSHGVNVLHALEQLRRRSWVGREKVAPLFRSSLRDSGIDRRGGNRVGWLKVAHCSPDILSLSRLLIASARRQAPCHAAIESSF